MTDAEQDQVEREAIDETLDIVEEFLNRTVEALDLDDDFDFNIDYVDDVIVVDMDGGRDDIALVIGKRGQTLDAIQYLVNAIVIAQTDEPVGVRVDAHGYRGRRRKQLEVEADHAMAEVSRRGDRVEMDPMTSSERKIVHLYLQERDVVDTTSIGREPNRRIVVLPRNDD